ncbi:acetylgalactosaminyl-proteoglycan 3-beta-glucuronosyltransferase, partial [Rodentibacter caecimuris]
NILSKAVHAYTEKDYQNALNLFRQAGNVYGEHIVKFHIDRCLTFLNQQQVTIKEQKIEVKHTLSSSSAVIISPQTNLSIENLDIATRILLANEKKIVLTEEQKQSDISHWQLLTAQKSQNAETKIIKPIPDDFPKDLILAPLPENLNDFNWNLRRKHGISNLTKSSGLSVIVPTFNRSHILNITLACLVNQMTDYDYEVIVADDGSKEDIASIVKQYEDKLDVKYVRQKDYGYQLCAVRNLGLRTAKYDFVSILDCDMAPNPKWVQSYMELLLKDDDVALIGPRKYIDTHNITREQILNNSDLIENLPEVRTNNAVAGKDQGEISVDWRLEHFQKTENLRLCDSPFRYFSGGNVAFAKKWLDIAGWFDEEFTHWGGEDNEFGYRLFRHGCFFRAVDGGMAYHQEPPGKENETDRDEGKKITLNIVREKVPYFYRKLQPIEASHIHRVPLVSIYIPAYNCASTIQRCVDSALNQTVTDLEVCICNDGSTDNTLSVLIALYGNNPRVRILDQKNGGIASASNSAVANARGYYIAQLDSDDYIEPDAVELCLKEFLKDRSLACVYTTNRNVNPDGSLIANGYNWPEFSREKMTTAMIVHHFRMFTARAWYLTEGFDEKIENSVDYDMYLKLSEVGKFKHINKICYNRVLHGNNTSIKKLGIQKKNHFLVVNASLKRQGITHYSYDAQDNDDASRKYVFNCCATHNGVYKTVEQVDAMVSIPQQSSVALQEKQKVETSLAFSLVCSGKPQGLIKKLENILEYNPQVKVIIIHIDKRQLNVAIQSAVEIFEKENKICVLLNSEQDMENARFRQIEYHYSNFKQLTEQKIQTDYIVFDYIDNIFVQKNSVQYIQKFDMGINFGMISGYWKDSILSHKTLQNWIKEKLGKMPNELRIKGTAQGIFIKTELAKTLFGYIDEIIKKCILNNDLPKYLTEEIWLQVALLIFEKEEKTSLKKGGTLTYLPWERKLQWSQEQIQAARDGTGLPVNKYIIGNVKV